MLRAEKMSDLGELKRFEVGHGEAGIGAADIGDDGASASTVHLRLGRHWIGQRLRLSFSI